MKIVFRLFIYFISYNMVFAFPGDHNSLTCDKNFYSLKVSIFDNETQYNTGTPILKTIDEQLLIDYYRKTQTQLDTAWKKQNRANIISAIKADISNPATSKVYANIRNSHDTTFEGKPLHITKLGDSLSDFVDLYGVITPDTLANPNFPQPPIPIANLGNYSGYPLLTDSWSDYFSLVGFPYYTPMYVKNEGIAGFQTNSVMGILGTSSYLADDGWWDIQPTGNHCPVQGKTAVHSSLMIGGNDLLGAIATVPILPFFGEHIQEYILENISFITDWHIENGKKILLEGTIPIYSSPIGSYDAVRVNRKSLCSPLEDSIIKPQDVPWWICAFGPSVCRAMVKAAVAFDVAMLKAIKDFNNKFYNGTPAPAANDYTQVFGQLSAIPNFVSNLSIGGTTLVVTATSLDSVVDLTGSVMNSISPAKREFDGNWLLRTLSLQQACINDRITNDLGPSYKSSFGDYVDYLPLYSFFIGTENALVDHFRNFWVPKDSVYKKYNFTNLKENENILDAIHIGPWGYLTWASLIGTKLKLLKWDSNSDSLDPVIELDTNGPGRIIRMKSRQVGLMGKESSRVIQILNGKFGGYYREYQDGSAIYLKQLNDNTTTDSRTKFGIPYLVNGSHRVRYLHEGGPTGKLGFPISDKHCTAALACSVEDVDFECGSISDNHLDFIQHFHTDMKIGCVP